jgi:hypothetical protein
MRTLAIWNLTYCFLRYSLTLLVVFLFSFVAVAQTGDNPFELKERLPATAAPENTAAATVPTGNPFDLSRGTASALNPSNAPAAAPERNATGNLRSGQTTSPLVIQSTDPNKGRGSLLAIHVMLLLLLSGLWLLFGDLLRQCLRSTVNEGLMNQLYTRRSGGELGALWACYIFFFFSAGFFVYLLATRFDLSLGLGIWGSWLTYSLVVAAAVGIKNLVLLFYARLFPVRREVNRYAFAIMVFSILVGLFIAPINLLISYAPAGWRMTFIFGGLALIAGVYLLHLFRGIFIASRLATSRPVHILLYICAIEVAPLLLIYRYLSNMLA